MRHRVEVIDKSTNTPIEFRHCDNGDADAMNLLEQMSDDVEKPDNEGAIGGLISGTLMHASGQRWVSLYPLVNVKKEPLEEVMDQLSREDEVYGRIKDDHNYFLLTATSVERFLEPTFARLRENSLDTLLLSPPPSAMRALEVALLAGTQDGSVFDQLLRDAREKVNRFYEVYRPQLSAVQERHRHALAAFKNDRSDSERESD
jgi:hypothetical protein